MRMLVTVIFASICLSAYLAGSTSNETFSEEAMIAAVSKALPLIERSSVVSLKERSCFTCHNGAASVSALETARLRGFSIDEDNMVNQLQRAYSEIRSVDRRIEPGAFAPGQADGGGWKLLTLAAAEWPKDEVTEAGVRFLIEYNRDRDHWFWSQVKRPPTLGSSFTTTWVALRAIREFITPETALSVELRTAEALGWLLRTQSVDTEDSVSRLRGLYVANASAKDIEMEANKLLSKQHLDGGWAQLPRGESDAYATSIALIGFYESGSIDHRSPESLRALQYLLDTQLTDGSWQVDKRARALQPHYDSTFPHGQDQFISQIATSWAVVAMLQMIPPMVNDSFIASQGDRISDIEVDKTAQTFTESEVAFFREKIEPVLIESCFKCHSEESEKLKADLYLDSREGMLIGGENGPVIMPEDPDGSLILDALYGIGIDEMPPKKGPLPDETIALFEQWIKMGAPHTR
ncbi:MAG: hypothetical protein O7C75_21870 [Verrucomicrobia bacterium]|nr:hypothetical protein [Verrucomicrobiota bacterium]